jgi:hypothetical protein
MQTRRKPKEFAEEMATTPSVAPSVVDGCFETPPQAGSSPALTLQQRLAEAWEEPEGGEPPSPRWSPRSTLFFSGGISLLLWGAVAAVVAAMR